MFADANWAGCRRDRESTPGGAIMIGAHLIRTYSKTQATIAKSSGESELYALVRASAGGLGICTLLSDFGVPDPRVVIGMDAADCQESRPAQPVQPLHDKCPRRPP